MDNLQGDFENLINKYLTTREFDGDWSRFDFTSFNVSMLQECFQSLKIFSQKFSKTSNPELNKQTIELMYALQFEIRNRPFKEQYPEIWDPLIKANETIDRISSTQEKNFIELSGWQKNFNKHLDPVFTNLALEYLHKTKPNNTFVNVFEKGSITQNWTDPDFEIDGLIYDETENIFYIIESKYFLTEDGLSKTADTVLKFTEFINSDKPFVVNDPKSREKSRRWNYFFDKDCGVVRNDKETTTVSVFLGYHSPKTQHLTSMAKQKNYTLIGPYGEHYKVYP